jgi:hypothetical protein
MCTPVQAGSDATSTPDNPSHHAAQGREYSRSGWQQPPRPGDPREAEAPVKGQPKKYEAYSPAGNQGDTCWLLAFRLLQLVCALAVPVTCVHALQGSRLLKP